jgi:hypothetical protein
VLDGEEQPEVRWRRRNDQTHGGARVSRVQA